MILNGKKVAEKIYSQLQEEIQKLDKKPTLGAILVGENSASLNYIRQKKKWAKFVGIDFQLFQFPLGVSQEELEKKIISLNNNSDISGYIIQLPLPQNIDVQKIVEMVLPQKDIDGFHPINQGKVLIGDISGLVACTPAGIMELLASENIELRGKKVVVIGKSNIVGKPITLLLINAGATVTSCNSKTPDISEFTKNADIVITATGVPEILKKESIGKNTIVIDVGFGLKDGVIVGDADFDSIEQSGNLITPVPGGVGPMTVAMLMSNTLLSHKRQLGIK